jgi:hypothetical protein
MARDYNLDPEAAKQANTGGKRITESGGYAGTFKAAFYEKNEKGTEAVHLMFESDAGQEVGPLAIYTHKGDGTTLPGFNALNALMTCLKVRALESKRGKVDLYDFDSQKMVTKDKDVYPALVGKRVGLVLRREEYEKRSGEIGERMTLAASYDPDSRLMASEILGKVAEPAALDRMLDWVDKNPVKHLKNGRPAAASTARTAADDFVDDDIPF